MIEYYHIKFTFAGQRARSSKQRMNEWLRNAETQRDALRIALAHQLQLIEEAKIIVNDLSEQEEVLYKAQEAIANGKSTTSS